MVRSGGNLTAAVVPTPTLLSISTVPPCNSTNLFDRGEPTRGKAAKQSPVGHRTRVCGSHNAMSWYSNNNTIIAIKATTNGAAPIITS